MDAHSHFVVGYDGSTSSELAIYRAVKLGAGSPLSLVHVICFVEESDEAVQLPTGEVMSRWAAIDFLRHTVLRLAKDWLPGAPEVRVAVHLKKTSGDADDIAQRLVDLAYRVHADEIVLGARGQGQTGHGSVGSVARAVLDYSDIPVHLESAMNPSAGQPTNLLRWAYVFGGNALREEQLNSGENRNSAGT